MRTIAIKGIVDWQFTEPVFIGDTIHMRSRVLDIEVRARGRRAIVTWVRQITNQHGKVVQEGEVVTVVECRPQESGQRTVDSGQKIEDRRQKTEVGGRRAGRSEDR